MHGNLDQVVVHVHHVMLQGQVLRGSYGIYPWIFDTWNGHYFEGKNKKQKMVMNYPLEFYTVTVEGKDAPTNAMLYLPKTDLRPIKFTYTSSGMFL